MNIGALIGTISGVAGLLGGKKSSATGTSNALSDLLKSTAKRVGKTDPYADVNEALRLSQFNVQQLLDRSLGNVFSKYAVQGSRSDLPDSARSGVQRGVLADILNQRFSLEADARLQALPRYVNMVSALVGQGTDEARGKAPTTTGINVSAFSKDVGQLLQSLRRPSGKIF